MFHGGRRQRRAWYWGLSAGTVVVSSGVVVWISRVYEGGLGSGELRSALVGAVIGVAALALSAAALRQRPGTEPDLTAAAARLAQAVKNAESTRWRHLLGGDRVAIDVGYTLATGGGPRTATVVGAPALQLTSVAGTFRAARPRRLLVTGAAGAGKTVIVTGLVLELIKQRTPDEPVPVRLTLAEWEPSLPASDVVGNPPVRGWIARQLTRDYDIPPKLARDLVDNNVVLPVLDGLDEMEERAADALDALEGWADGTDPVPLVLTCRSERYDELAATGHQLLDAARIEVSPVTRQAAREYLAERTARREAAWHPLLASLERDPAGLVARALSTPWLLSLAATVYAREGEPADLLRCTTLRQVSDQLLGQYVRAAIHLNSATSARYTSECVHRWLRSLAVRLEGRTDMVPGPWLAPQRRFALVRAADMAVTTVLTATLTIFVLPALLHRPSRNMLLAPPSLLSAADNAFNNALLGLALCSACWWGATRPLSSQPSVAAAPLHRLRPSHVRRIVVAELRNPETVGFLATMAAVWTTLAALGVLHGPARGDAPLAAVVAGCGIGYCIVLHPVLVALRGTGPAGDLAPAFVSPRDVMPADWLFGVGVSLGSLPTQFYGGPWAPPLVIALTLWTFSRSSCRYLLALLLAAGYLPFRLARFLHWAHGAGLLRVSGPAYQFRHREFQEWLIRHPEPVRQQG
ncbi:NACHT domain-containing protein [Streptomyces sp. NPDC127077]|uniref:NACHT domain-containing protein n=1 Tax=Streptomyces sp. NPDC127077 TaxID=3347131 RepID=UPI0036577066